MHCSSNHACLFDLGALAQLQPVAVGMNGEIEFVLVPPESTPQQSIDLRAIHQASVLLALSHGQCFFQHFLGKDNQVLQYKFQ